MKNKQAILLFLRYFSLLLIPLFGFFIVYYLITPPTVYSSFFILKLFFNASLLPGNIIFINGTYISLIEACIAATAYYFLLILNLTTPMRLKKRIKSLSFLLLSFFVLNVFRIVLFSFIFVKKYDYFDTAHKLVWYFGSTLLVIILWFVNIALFKIKAIPVYSDISSLFNEYPKKNYTNKNKKRK